MHKNKVMGEPVPGVTPVSKNLLLIGEPCAPYDFMREKSTGKPASPRTNCWEEPVKDRRRRSTMFATQKASDKKPLKNFEAAIHRPMYNKSATVPTQTDSPEKKSVGTHMPTPTWILQPATFLFTSLCRGHPVLTEQYVGKRPSKRERVNERAKQARQAATDPAAGQTPAYVPAEAIDLDMSFAEPLLYHTPQDFLPIASATSMGSLSVDSSQDEENNILEMSHAEDMDHGSPQMQQETGHEQQPSDMNTMQPPSDTVTLPMANTEHVEQSVVTSPRQLPAEFTNESPNQIIDVVIERATRNVPAREAETTTSVKLRSELDVGNEKLERGPSSGSLQTHRPSIPSSNANLPCRMGLHGGEPACVDTRGAAASASNRTNHLQRTDPEQQCVKPHRTNQSIDHWTSHAIFEIFLKKLEGHSAIGKRREEY